MSDLMKSILSEKWKDPAMVRVIIILLFGAIMGFLCRGSFYFILVILGAATLYYIITPALIVAWIWAAIRGWQKREVSLEFKGFASVLAAIACAIGISLGIGYLARKMEKKNTHDYARDVVPLLIAYRNEHGQYPETIKEVYELRSPSLLMKNLKYSSSDEHFQFSYEVDDRFNLDKSEWVFSSRRLGWSFYSE